MTVLLTRCRVADFDAWRPRFDAFASAQPAILSCRIWHGADDPNLVVLMETWDSREAADAILSDPRLQEAMVEDGVDLSSVTLDFLDEVSRGKCFGHLARKRPSRYRATFPNTRPAERLGAGGSHSEGVKSFHCPSETTSTAPSTTCMAVSSSSAYPGADIRAAHSSALAMEWSGMFS